MSPLLYKPNGIPFTRDELPSGMRRRSGAGIPDLDPNFWLTNSSSLNVSAGDVERLPYQYHWLIYVAASVIASNVSTKLIKKFRRKDSQQEITSGELVEIFKRPNPLTSPSITTFVEHICLHLLLPAREKRAEASTGGQSHLLCTKLGKPINIWAGELPDEICPYSDDYVSPWVSATQGGMRAVHGWYFHPSRDESVKVPMPLSTWVRIFTVNPYDPLKGMSPFLPALTTVASDIYSEIWNASMYRNDAVPAGIVNIKQLLDPDSRRELEQNYYDRYSGPTNAKKIAFMYGDAEYQPVGSSPKDMEFQAQKKRTDDILTAVYKINKIARGTYEDVNYATIIEGRRMLWDDNYLVIDNRITEAINSGLVQYIDPQIEWYSDTSKVRPLQPDNAGKASAVSLYCSAGAPFTLACQIANVELPKDAAKKYPWLDENPKDALWDGLEMSEDDKDDEDGASAEDEEETPVGDGDEKTLDRKAPSGYSAEEIREISRAYIQRVLEPGEKSMLQMFIRFFQRQKSLVLDKVDEWQKKAREKSLAPEIGEVRAAVEGQMLTPEMFLLDQLTETGVLFDQYAPQVAQQMARELAKLKEEIPNIGWNLTKDKIEKYAESRREVLRTINSLTFKKIQEEVSDIISIAVLDNMTIDQTAAALKEGISEVYSERRNHSRTVARTEIGSISSQERYEVMAASGVAYMQWVNAADEKVRINHQEKPVGDGGEVTTIDGVFPHTGMRYPLDPSGPPEEIINCRCSTVPIFRDSEEQ